MARRVLPSGTVTFVFTDIEGSTRVLREVGSDAYGRALGELRRTLRGVVTAHGGVEFNAQGDSSCIAFSSPPEALEAVRHAQAALADGPLRVRIGIHTGMPQIVDGDYVGMDVHLAARIAAAGHGGQVLVSEPTAGLVGPDGLVDLGDHWLKDFDTPVRLFQLGEGRFPPLHTVSATNLPRAASSFVGRERELKEVLGRLRNGARLVTLTGPGGSGKTRLAIEAAAELVADFPGGVFWVGLAPVRDANLVIETIAQTLGAKDELAAHVGDRQLLLLLDNFEQVVDAAADMSALVADCPNLRVLVTSRERLRVQGEVEYPVPPLADPEAVELFVVRSGLEADRTVSELCRRLDNLPLAVELAAARTSVLSPAQILERLSGRLDLLKGSRDAEVRQQTLRATIAWSFDLLDEAEKALFARLAVFRGGTSLEAAEEVCDADLDTLQSLVDKSLVRHRDERFWMLETIRAYAAERLEESGEADELRRRHAEHYLALAEQVEPHLLGSPEPWLDSLEDEHDNLRAALDYLVSAGETQLVLELAALLWRFWTRHGHLTEGYRRLMAALAADSSPTPERARALIGAGAMAQWQGDTAATVRHAEAALTLHEEFGDPWGIALSSYLLADEPAAERDWARARDVYEQCLHSFIKLGDDHHTLMARRAFAWMCLELGERDRYVALTEENLRMARSTGNRRYEGLSLAALAGEARDDGRFDEALAMLEDAYRIHRELGERIEITVVLARFARALAAVGRPKVAARLLASSEKERERLGAGLESWVAEMNGQTRQLVLARLDEADFAEAWEEGVDLTPDEAFAFVIDLRPHV